MLYQTHARVDLGAIRDNIAAIRRAVGYDRKILIAVKANAYGHGAVAVSRLAQSSGVDWLGVATVPEGLELRAAGISLPILKFSPAFPEEMAAAIEAGLALCVCERSNIAALEAAAAAAVPAAGRAQGVAQSGIQAGAPAERKRVAVHLKIDTGMGRIGASPEDAATLALFIEKECPHLYLQGVFTHLPVSDDDEPAFTSAQLERFAACVQNIVRAIGRRPELVHCSNSGAVVNHPAAWLDMVRPGIMVYGIYTGVTPALPAATATATAAAAATAAAVITGQSSAGNNTSPFAGLELRPALSFLTKVSFLKKVKAGTTVGYGRTWTAPRDTWIATIPAGYADGFNRLFSNKGRVLINGRSYPLAGRVCMDQSMVDLGPETEVRVGDEVILLGKSGSQEISCAEWAKALGTITYEVTCQIGSRVQRLHVN